MNYIFCNVPLAAEFKREWTNFPGKAKSVVWKYFGFWKIIKQDAPSEIVVVPYDSVFADVHMS
jgi:hypothetical protein